MLRCLRVGVYGDLVHLLTLCVGVPIPQSISQFVTEMLGRHSGLWWGLEFDQKMRGARGEERWHEARNKGAGDSNLTIQGKITHSFLNTEILNLKCSENHLLLKCVDWSYSVRQSHLTSFQVPSPPPTPPEIENYCLS